MAVLASPYMNVSVCIPTFNQAAYLEQAIRSCAGQTLQPVEIIVSNDCSTDNTQEVLFRLSNEINILRVINHPQNLGISKNTDFCLRQAAGEFILRLDSDDYLSPLYLDKLVQQLTENPAAGYAHAAVQEIDKNGHFLKKRLLARKSGFQDSASALKAAVSGFRVAANILIFRKEALNRVGYIASKVNFAEDYYLVASLAEAGYGNVYLNEILSYYRVWNDTGKVRQRRKMDEIAGYRTLFEQILEPAFKKRQWDLAPLERARKNFAVIHAYCLSWKVYNMQEKAELLTELYKVSSKPEVKLASQLYLCHLGFILQFYQNAKGGIKYNLKKIISKINR